MNKDFKHLFRLIDDESEQSASMVMAGILEHEHEGRLDDALRRLQEANDVKLRRRIHQLQSIMILRRRRKLLAQKLESRNLDLLDGLVEMHMLWYDNDSAEAVRKEWSDLMEESKSYRPSTLERLSYFMRKKGFSCPGKDDVEADYYCLGTILEEFVGAEVVLCAIAKLIGAAWGMKLKIIQHSDSFVVIDEAGQSLKPASDWKILPSSKKNYREWDAQATFKLVAAMLFVCAVSSDSFRYVHTIGTCLGKASGGEGIEILPYPYSGLANPEGAKPAGKD